MKLGIAASVVIVSMIGFAQLAKAQVGLDDLTAREMAWGQQLGAAVGKQASQARPPANPVHGQTSGVTTWLRWEHGGTFAGVTRLKFATAADAQAYAVSIASIDHDVKHDTAIEVRGDQVVVVVGQLVAQPEQARKLAAAAWGGLPVSEPVDTALTKLRDGSIAFTTNVDGPARATIAEDLRSARAFKEATNSDVVTNLTPDTAVAKFEDGTRLSLQATPNGAALARSASPAGYETMTRYLTALRGMHAHRPAEQTTEPAVGASTVVEGLFGKSP